MSALCARAPAKINLGLWLGPPRTSDGRHEIVTVMQSISLADELTLERRPGTATEDEVICPGVPGPPQENLAAAALRSFRAATGWEAGPLRLSIVKRIPVAAGLGGGSADAAATLRLLRRASGLGDEQLLYGLARSLGIAAERAKTVHETTDLVARGLNGGGPLLVDVELDRAFKPM